MSSTETHNRKTENGGLARVRFAPASTYFPVKIGCAGFGIHELDRLRGLALSRSSDEGGPAKRAQRKSPGYVRNYAADEMRQTQFMEKILMCVLAVGGVVSIWAGVSGMTQMLARWSGFVDLMGSVLR